MFERAQSENTYLKKIGRRLLKRRTFKKFEMSAVEEVSEERYRGGIEKKEERGGK